MFHTKNLLLCFLNRIIARSQKKKQRGKKGDESLSEKEKEVMEAVKKALPEMSERDKGYFLGFAEGITRGREQNEEKEPETERI